MEQNHGVVEKLKYEVSLVDYNFEHVMDLGGNNYVVDERFEQEHETLPVEISDIVLTLNEQSDHTLTFDMPVQFLSNKKNLANKIMNERNDKADLINQKSIIKVYIPKGADMAENTDLYFTIATIEERRESDGTLYKSYTCESMMVDQLSRSGNVFISQEQAVQDFAWATEDGTEEKPIEATTGEDPYYFLATGKSARYYVERILQDSEYKVKHVDDFIQKIPTFTTVISSVMTNGAVDKNKIDALKNDPVTGELIVGETARESYEGYSPKIRSIEMTNISRFEALKKVAQEFDGYLRFSLDIGEDADGNRTVEKNISLYQVPGISKTMYENAEYLTYTNKTREYEKKWQELSQAEAKAFTAYLEAQSKFGARFGIIEAIKLSMKSMKDIDPLISANPDEKANYKAAYHELSIQKAKEEYLIKDELLAYKNKYYDYLVALVGKEAYAKSQSSFFEAYELFYDKSIRWPNTVFEYGVTLRSLSRQTSSNEVFTKLYGLNTAASETGTVGMITTANPDLNAFVLNLTHFYDYDLSELYEDKYPDITSAEQYIKLVEAEYLSTLKPLNQTLLKLGDIEKQLTRDLIQLNLEIASQLVLKEQYIELANQCVYEFASLLDAASKTKDDGTAHKLLRYKPVYDPAGDTSGRLVNESEIEAIKELQDILAKYDEYISKIRKISGIRFSDKILEIRGNRNPHIPQNNLQYYYRFWRKGNNGTTDKNAIIANSTELRKLFKFRDGDIPIADQAAVERQVYKPDTHLEEVNLLMGLRAKYKDLRRDWQNLQHLYRAKKITKSGTTYTLTKNFPSFETPVSATATISTEDGLAKSIVNMAASIPAYKTDNRFFTAAPVKNKVDPLMTCNILYLKDQIDMRLRELLPNMIFEGLYETQADDDYVLYKNLLDNIELVSQPKILYTAEAMDGEGLYRYWDSCFVGDYVDIKDEVLGIDTSTEPDRVRSKRFKITNKSLYLDNDSLTTLTVSNINHYLSNTLDGLIQTVGNFNKVYSLADQNYRILGAIDGSRVDDRFSLNGGLTLNKDTMRSKGNVGMDYYVRTSPENYDGGVDGLDWQVPHSPSLTRSGAITISEQNVKVNPTFDYTGFHEKQTIDLWNLTFDSITEAEYPDGLFYACTPTGELVLNGEDYIEVIPTPVVTYGCSGIELVRGW